MTSPWATMVGFLLGGVPGALVANRLVKAIGQQLEAWNQLPDAEKLELLQKMQALAPPQLHSLSGGYSPIREEMASMAAQNGIDPGFLYK